MKRNSLRDLIVYFAVKIVGVFVRRLPIEIDLWFGRWLGDIAYLIGHRRQHIAELNLKAAAYFSGKPKVESGDFKRIVHQSYQNLGQSFIEMLYFPRMDRDYINKYIIECEGIWRIKEALKKGKGIIFLTGHFGNWELSSQFVAIIGHPVKVLARQQGYSRLNLLLNYYRESKGCRVVTKGMGIREIFRGLHNNEAIGILADQHGGKGGVFVNFFGRPTSTATGAIQFALKTDSMILPSFIIRLKGPYHKIIIEAPIEIDESLGQELIIQSTLQKFTSLLESYITQYPGQWLWMHRRWKSTPARSILILDDGKVGHLNQTRAVFKEIDKNWGMGADGKTRSPEHRAQSQIVKIVYKNNFTRLLLKLWAMCPGKSRWEGRLYLKACLTKKSYKSLINTYADIVISCGDSLSPINFIISRENNAKSIVVMKPVSIPTKRFGLVIIPKHDRPHPAPNAVLTDGAPNLIDGEEMKKGVENITSVYNLQFKDRSLRIGLLIGGDTKGYGLTIDTMGSILDNIVRAVNELDGEVMATTSRRTSKEVEILLKERLGNFDRCRLLIIANEANINGAVSGILGLCQVVITSPESISMVSEAASSGKYVLVFKDEALNRRKHNRFLDGLHADGYIYLVKPDDIYDTIKKLWQEKPPVKVLNDAEIIKKGVTRLL